MPVQVQSPYLQNNLCSSGHSIFKESCKACGSMRKEWYRYLNNTGFEDIERGLNIIAPTSELNLRIDFHNNTTFQAKRDYYQWAQECLTTCSFDSMIDRLIWQHHSEAYSSREIAPIVGLSQQWITCKLKNIKSKIKSR